MKPHTLLLSAVIIALITMMGFVGVSAYTEGDAEPILLLLVGVMTPIVTTILTLLTSKKTLTVSQDTDKKVDDLLNGSLKTRIDTMEKRVGNIERSLIEILAKLA